MVSSERRVGPDLKTTRRSNFSLAFPDPLTHTIQVLDDCQWLLPLILPGSFVLFLWWCRRFLYGRGNGADQGKQINVLLVSSGGVFFFLPPVLLLYGNVPGPVEETPDNCPLRTCWVVGAEVYTYLTVSVCISFLKIVRSRVPPSLPVSLVSRKGRVPSLSSSMVYVGEMQRHLETQVKEHWDACNKGDKSAIAKHQWDQQYQVDWGETRVLDRAARPVQLKVKEALRSEKTPANNTLNQDVGYELPGCCIVTIKKLGGRGNRASANSAGASASSLSHMGARAQ